jgi:hypothetical protein
MGTYTNRTINANGLEQIRAFLIENHKSPECFEGPEALPLLHAWARDAEFQMGEGNTPTIEIKSFNSIHGRTQEFDIGAEGVDSEEVEIDE